MKKDRKLFNRCDLLQELNRLKKKEFGENAVPISMEQIFKYCNPKNTKIRRYRTFCIRKKHGGTREISAPYRTLHSIQRALNAFLKEIYTPKDCAMGFAPGRSVVDNAKVHRGHNYVLNMDLKDFFPSISEGRVIARLQLPPFNFNKEIAQVIGGLCAIRIEDDKGFESFVLPQGAPTSPLLTNAICDSLDRKLIRLARDNGLHYSRYADDMTFSSMQNVYQKDGDFFRNFRKIVSDEGFIINDDKTRLQKRGARQVVTGLTVNDKINVARQYIHELRCILHIWETYGYADAYARFYPKYKKDKGYIKKGEPILENVIEGKLNYLKMVKGKSDKVLQKLFYRYLAVRPCVYKDKETDKGCQYLFVQSYTVQEFEKRFETKIQLCQSKQETIIGKCTLFEREKFISVSKKTQDWLKHNSSICVLNDSNLILSCKDISLCYITLCRQKAKNFWLLTQNKPKKTEILKLNYQNIPIAELIQKWNEDGIKEAADLFYKYCIGEVKPSKETGKETKKEIKKEQKALTKKDKHITTSILSEGDRHNFLDMFIDSEAFDINDSIEMDSIWDYDI